MARTKQTARRSATKTRKAPHVTLHAGPNADDFTDGEMSDDSKAETKTDVVTPKDDGTLSGQKETKKSTKGEDISDDESSESDDEPVILPQQKNARNTNRSSKHKNEDSNSKRPMDLDDDGDISDVSSSSQSDTEMDDAQKTPKGPPKKNKPTPGGDISDDESSSEDEDEDLNHNNKNKNKPLHTDIGSNGGKGESDDAPNTTNTNRQLESVSSLTEKTEEVDLGNVVDTARSVVDQVCCFINAGLFCANWDYTEGCLSILD